MLNLTLEDVKRIDPTEMYQWLSDFPKQVEDAVRIGRQSKLILKVKGVRSLLVTGMGGSAIGGDLIRSYLLSELKVPFSVSRSYTLPAFVSRNTLVVVSSYSGNTEETLSAYRQAIQRGAIILCMTAGGEAERLARKHNHPCIKVPGGLQPRAALAYSFFPLLIALSRLGFIKAKGRDIKETIDLLGVRSHVFRNPANRKNLPLRIAGTLQGRLPILYSATDHLDAINLRWRGQISENAKQLAYGNVLSEMNHNEIVGWNVNRPMMKRLAVVFLRDRGTYSRIQLREEITKRIVKEYAADVVEVWSEGRSLLARVFSLVYLGDWMSYYLAILNKQNPTPVAVIDYLKNALAKR